MKLISDEGPPSSEESFLYKEFIFNYIKVNSDYNPGSSDYNLLDPFPIDMVSSTADKSFCDMSRKHAMALLCAP